MPLGRVLRNILAEPVSFFGGIELYGSIRGGRITTQHLLWSTGTNHGVASLWASEARAEVWALPEIVLWDLGLGIVGLASFSVARRTKQIGTRRALGATRPAILRYFMLENFVISTVGVVGGAVIAVGINMWMVEAFGLQRIAWYLIPAAMLTLWIVGQVAVLGPARRATTVPPALATRSV